MYTAFENVTLPSGNNVSEIKVNRFFGKNNLFSNLRWDKLVKIKT